jgi:transcriptional regulator with XRE-family HTH domain
MGIELVGSFTRNIRTLREAMQISKSELARRIWGTVIDSRGYEVSRNRDRIGAWESGKAVPTPANLLLLAQVFKVTVAELAPDLVARNAPSSSNSALALQSVDGDPGKVILRINMTLPMSVAFDIVKLLQDAGLGNGETS